MSDDRLELDGREVPCATTVLATCRSAGVDVPAFCRLDGADSGGHCRSCMVEVDGRVVAACTTVARPGMRVATDTERLRAYRRDLGELVLAEARPAGEVAQVLQRWGCDGRRYAPLPRDARRDGSHPYLRLALDACIHCRKCERACAEIQGRFVYAFEGRGAEARLGWGGGPFAATACVGCGACVAACPTAAITDVDRIAESDASSVRTTCAFCGVGCQLEVHGKDGRVVRIDGVRTSPVNAGHLCIKGRYAHGFVHHPDRLTQPLLRRDGALVPVSWPEAIAAVSAAFARAAGRVAALSSARCTNEENYLVQKWMRAGQGTHDVDCCARVCHAPTAAGMRRVLGTGAATNSLADLEHADAILVAGSNTTEAHPVTGARIVQATLRGAKLVVIDPRRTELAELADVHLQLRPGTNVVLLNALACAIVEAGLHDETFLAARTSGWTRYREHLAAYRPEATAAVTGVPAETVRAAAEIYGRASRPMQVHGLGMTEHYQGSESVMLLCNLALLCGAIGRPGTGVNPLRGQNNVQGAADMGCQPDLLTGYADPRDAAVRERFERAWGRPLPTHTGRTIPAMYEAARRGDIRVMYILGEDVVQTDPAVHVREALAALDVLIVQELFLSETAKLADIVLPGASFLEKDGTFTNGERRIQRVRRVVDPPGEARPDWEILCALMTATGLPQHFRDPSEIMAELAGVAPIFAGVRYDRLDGDGLQWPVPTLDHPGTPLLHVESFPHGRAELACIDFAPSPALALHGGAHRPLRLVTGRVLAHYNCGTQTRRTDNVQLVDGDMLEIHPDDAAARGIESGQSVTIASDFGQAHARARVTERVPPGTVFLSFHFAETGTNRVVGDVLDRLADTPEYKLTPVEVERG